MVVDFECLVKLVAIGVAPDHGVVQEGAPLVGPGEDGAGVSHPAAAGVGGCKLGSEEIMVRDAMDDEMGVGSQQLG